MKPTHLGRTTAVLLLVLVSGPLATLPLGAAPVPKEAPKEELYFSIKKGTKWVYEYRDGALNKEVTETATSVEYKPKEGVWIVTLGLENKNGKMPDEYKWEVSKQGLVDTWIHEGVETKPERSLKLPHLANEKWECYPGDKDFHCVTLDKQKVKVPAGEYEAIGVERHHKGGPSQQYWYALNVGIVRIGDEKNPYSVLKSFTPGKD
jgi:hypothetical protein